MTKRPSRRLTFEDAVQIQLRRMNGEYQHDIAAAFGINQGRVSEIVNGHRFFGSRLVALMRHPQGILVLA